MNLSSFPVGVLGGGGPLRLLGPDNPGRLVVKRASAGSVITAAQQLGSVVADAPRFTGTARRLLVEGARSNQLRNPRLLGAVAATGTGTGTMPTYVSQIGDAVGLSWQVVGSGTESGIPYFDLRLFGTRTTSSVGWRLALETATQVAAASGQSWTTSFFARRVAGTTALLTLRAGFNLRSDSGSFLGVPAVPLNAQPTGAALAGQRLSGTYLIDGYPTTAGLRPEILFTTPTADQTVDETFRIGAPQAEQAVFASTPMLPPDGTASVASREADQPTWSPPAGFGTQGTVVISAMLPQLAPFGSSQGLWQIDDGTDQNRILLRNTSAGSAITGVVDVAGTTVATLSAGNMAPGTPFRVAFAWAPGEQALCLTGGTVQVAAASLPGGLARMLLGHASTQLNRAAHGEVELLEYRPTRLPNGMLQALANLV